MCRAVGCLPVTVKKVVCNLETIKYLLWQILLWLDFQSWISLLLNSFSGLPFPRCKMRMEEFFLSSEKNQYET